MQLQYHSNNKVWTFKCLNKISFLHLSYTNFLIPTIIVYTSLTLFSKIHVLCSPSNNPNYSPMKALKMHIALGKRSTVIESLSKVSLILYDIPRLPNEDNSSSLGLPLVKQVKSKWATSSSLTLQNALTMHVNTTIIKIVSCLNYM